jgi:hypothetical protein
MLLVYSWVPPYLYEELFTMSCIGYVHRQQMVMKSEWHNLHKDIQRKIRNIGITDLMKYLDKLSVGYEGRIITTASYEKWNCHVAEVSIRMYMDFGGTNPHIINVGTRQNSKQK